MYRLKLGCCSVPFLSAEEYKVGKNILEFKPLLKSFESLRVGRLPGKYNKQGMASNRGTKQGKKLAFHNLPLVVDNRVQSVDTRNKILNTSDLSRKQRILCC